MAESTFKNYTASQAVIYAKSRGTYPPALYEDILQHHSRTGGQFGRLLDVGCGPGNSTVDLAEYFDHATGLDPSESMIENNIGGKTKIGEAIEYKVGKEDDLATICQDGDVDLLTAAMSAHWFNLDRWWEQAGKILRPGGTVAIWTRASFFIHPDSHPRAGEVQKILSDLEDVQLRPYAAPGNLLSQDRYRDPGFMPPSSTTWEADVYRREWDVDGVPTSKDRTYLDHRTTTLKETADGLSTASMVTRWRAANPTPEKDVVTDTIDKIKQVTGWTDETEIVTGSTIVLIMAKKKRSQSG